jgi:type I restriction enzyme S subunit
MRETTGSRMPRADMDDLIAMTIPLPPLPEQKRIAAILNEQMAAVEKARAACEAQLEAAKALPAGYLRSVFDSPEAKKWERKRLGDACDSIDYGFTASADFSVEEPRLLRITDIQNGKVDWRTVPGCRITPKEEAANSLSDGDIVFARTGGTTGKSFLVKEPPGRAVFASYLIRLRARSALPEYLYLFFQSDDYWRQVGSSQRGGAQPNCNASLLANVVLPMPSLSEQQRAVEVLNDQLGTVDTVKVACEAQLDLVDAIPSAILRRAFQGELKPWQSTQRDLLPYRQ